MPSNAVFLILLIAVIFQLPAYSQDQKYINQEPISERLNSQFDELHPVISPDGQFLFYTIRFHPKNIGGELDPGDIWISELKSNSEWSKPENAGELWNNTGYNILFKFFASGQKALLLTQNEGEKPTLAISSLINNNWSEPRLIKIQSYYNRSGHLSATISEDGEVLILSMESFGSLGYEDLYVSFRENDSVYSEPVILGGSINTTFQEMTPYLSGDGLTLYVASNGHVGDGGRDIFSSKRLDETWGNWSRPVNLGPGVNSQGIELSFFETNWHSFAYVSSTQNSRGMGDIFRMSITDSQFQLVAANSNQPKIARPQQIEAKAEIEKVELEKSEQEEAQVVTKAVEVVSEEKVTVVAKREVFEGQALTTSKDINLKQSANLTKSDRNLASVVVESSSAKVSGRILSSNTRKPLSASIKFENNENAFTDSEGNFDILISKNQRRKAWVTAEGMKP